MVGPDNGDAYALFRAAIPCTNTRGDSSAVAHGAELFREHIENASGPAEPLVNRHMVT